VTKVRLGFVTSFLLVSVALNYSLLYMMIHIKNKITNDKLINSSN